MEKAYLDTPPIRLDLPPTHSLVGPRPGIAPIKLLRGVDIDGALGAIAHQTRIRDMMLDDAAAEDDHAGPLGAHGDGVDAADVGDDVDA